MQIFVCEKPLHLYESMCFLHVRMDVRLRLEVVSNILAAACPDDISVLQLESSLAFRRWWQKIWLSNVFLSCSPPLFQSLTLSFNLWNYVIAIASNSNLQCWNTLRLNDYSCAKTKQNTNEFLVYVQLEYTLSCHFSSEPYSNDRTGSWD